ncbi:hypothetical protein GOODEAATRI_020663 [Goodea atripinnis]|uniref:Aberrant panicle organization 1 protein n=1 Tax=Goodea atripinnis TaxID=208336 RepID=A0ABV0NW94_9TELE
MSPNLPTPSPSSLKAALPSTFLTRRPIPPYDLSQIGNLPHFSHPRAPWLRAARVRKISPGSVRPTRTHVCARAACHLLPTRPAVLLNRYLVLAGPVRSLRFTQHRLRGALLVLSADKKQSALTAFFSHSRPSSPPQRLLVGGDAVSSTGNPTASQLWTPSLTS